MVGYPTGEEASQSQISFENFDWVESLEDHKHLYGNWRHPTAFDFLFHNDRTISLGAFARRPSWSEPTTMEELRLLAQKLDKIGLTLLWTEITTNDVGRLGRCVKVVVPQMMPLSAQHNMRFLDCQRLREKSQFQKAAVADFNIYPHPFA